MDRFALSNAPYLHQKCRSQNCGATLTKLNIISWGYSSAGRVLDWQSRGHGFEPRYLHHPFSELLFLPELFIFGSGHYFGHYGSFSSISPAITFAAFAFAFLTAWV